MAGTRAITLTPTSTGNRRKQPDRKARPKKRPRSPTNSEKIERLRIQKLQDPPRIVIDCCSSNSIGPLSKSHEGYSAGSIMDKKYVWSTDEELFVLQLLHGNTDEQLRFYKCKKDYYEVVA